MNSDQLDFGTILNAPSSVAKNQSPKAQKPEQTNSDQLDYDDKETIKSNICKICTFYDLKALHESRKEHSEKLPLIEKERQKVLELLTIPKVLSQCTPDAPPPPPKAIYSRGETTCTGYS